MSKKIIYQGRTYILENELPEEYSYEEDEDVKPTLDPKEQEAEDEINRATEQKNKIQDRSKGLGRMVDYFYSKYVSRYSTANEMRMLLRAIYEIIAKRFLTAKKSGDEKQFLDWRRLISDIPHTFITEGFDDNHLNQMVETYYYVIESTAQAMAFIMAITRRLNELAGQDESLEHEFDEIKEQIDSKLYSLLH